MNVTYDEAKFTEMLLYVAEDLRDDRSGGATKLDKVLYFADFAHMRRCGRPISGAEYQKVEHGPVPRRLEPVRRRLVSRGHADMVNDDFLGYEVPRLIPRRPADLSVLGTTELETIDKVLADLSGLTGKQVVDLSCDEPAWQLADEGETIPYSFALISHDQIKPPASRRVALEAALRYDISVSR